MSRVETLTLLSAALLATAGAGLLTATLWRRRSAPAVTPLLGVAVSLFAGSLAVSFLMGLDLSGALSMPVELAGTTLFNILTHIAVVLAAGFWILFAVGYTRRGLQLAVAGGVGLGWSLTTLVLLAVGYAQLWGSTPLQAASPLLRLSEFFLTGLALAGVFFILGIALRRTAVPMGEAGLLSIGMVLFGFAKPTATVFEQPIAAPVLFLLASLAFLFAVVRFPVFETVPAIRFAGRDRLVEEMDAGLVVTNRSGRIDDLNPAAAAMFAIDKSRAVGRPATAVLGEAFDPSADAGHDEPRFVRGSDGRVLSVTTNRITDTNGDFLGNTTICSDVTDRYRREYRMSLLTQFLVGTVQDRMVEILDRTERIAAPADDSSASPDPAVVGAQISGTTVTLQELVVAIRDMERDLARGATGDADVAAAVQSAVQAVDDSLPVITNLSEATVDTGIDPVVLRSILEHLLGSAADAGVDDAAVTLEATEPPIIRLSFNSRDVDAGNRDGDGADASSFAEVERSVDVVKIAIEQAGGTLSTTDAPATDFTLKLPPADDDQSMTERDSVPGRVGGPPKSGASVGSSENGTQGDTDVTGGEGQ